MKRRIRFILVIFIAGFMIYLPIWRLWPQSFANMMNVDKDSLSIVSAYVDVYDYFTPENYQLKNIDIQSNVSKEIVDILATSDYKPDFRNLLPWRLKSLDGGKNYDGRRVLLAFNTKNGEVGFIHFMSSGRVYVYGPDIAGNHIYHPTDSEAFDALVEYVQEHGVFYR